MAQKNNIRSIRFSDEMADLIDRQIGDNFTAKFEALITRCVWELPQKEQQLEQLDQQIKDKRHQLALMTSRSCKLESTLKQLSEKMTSLSYAINDATAEWDV